MTVADTNLVAYLLIDGEKTASARAVRATDSCWLLPTLWRSEFLNVLATSARAHVLTLAEAHDTWRLAQLVFAQCEVETSGDDVLETAAARNLSAYDAQFVVAATDLDVPLVTSDRRIDGDRRVGFARSCGVSGTSQTVGGSKSRRRC